MTSEAGEVVSLRWTTGASAADGTWPLAARALETGGAVALALDGGDARLPRRDADTLQRYLAFMAGMPVLRGEAGRGAGDVPALRIPRGARGRAIVEHARRVAAAGHDVLVCIVARCDGENDLCDTFGALRAVPLRTVWLYDACDPAGDVAWTQALHRRCSHSLSGVVAAGGFEVALRSCSHFIHGTRGRYEC
ncbi:hypothetical protein SB379_12410 [Burkholderia multivorans]|nr:hypothetical protein [Burkholderia multivorans]MBR8017333.1 hypothetical protein [Burkholderia multivorans]MEB2512706.1 hypothetical protein [Burkholderia multivorans]MEB2522274.1 hypothetical protein [Burkholderia multivorans]MEB2576834.1 hypothetical protein [Burkholderia multivorans]MEB2593548.1 hypothetical protein [Burkholderia multivorans]